MKHLTLILVLLLSFMHVMAWSQDETKNSPTTENTEEEAEEESEEIVKKKPKRLPSKLKRERFPKSEKSAMELLAEGLEDSSLVWLETQYGPFLSLWQKDRSGDAKGALLIIHAEGEHPAWPTTTKPLHETLPNNGWATLAISLPSPDKIKPPARTFPPKVIAKPSKISEDAEAGSDEQNKTATIAEEKNEKPEDNKNPEQDADMSKSTLANTPPADKSNAETEASAEAITKRRLEAALTFLHDKGQFNLVILGSGYGAIRAHDFLNKITPKVDNPALKAKLEKPMRAMIIVNGRNKLPTMEEEYKDWFSDPEIPVLDIYTQTDSRNQFEAEKRKILAMQNKAITFKQVKLRTLNPEKSWKENILSRRIRSFLDNNATGVEVENKTLRRFN